MKPAFWKCVCVCIFNGSLWWHKCGRSKSKIVNKFTCPFTGATMYCQTGGYTIQTSSLIMYCIRQARTYVHTWWQYWNGVILTRHAPSNFTQVSNIFINSSSTITYVTQCARGLSCLWVFVYKATYMWTECWSGNEPSVKQRAKAVCDCLQSLFMLD